MSRAKQAFILFLNIINASLSIHIASRRGIFTNHSPIPSVGLCVWSGKCTVAKWLIGSDCLWDGEWVRSSDG